VAQLERSVTTCLHLPPETPESSSRRIEVLTGGASLGLDIAVPVCLHDAAVQARHAVPGLMEEFDIGKDADRG